MDYALPSGRKSDPGTTFPWKQVLEDAKYIADKKAEKPALRSHQDAVVLSAADETWLQDFIHQSRVRKVQDGSLAYVTEVVRELRSQLGLSDDTSPKDLIDYLLEGTEYKNEPPENWPKEQYETAKAQAERNQKQ